MDVTSIVIYTLITAWCFILFLILRYTFKSLSTIEKRMARLEYDNSFLWKITRIQLGIDKDYDSTISGLHEKMKSNHH